MNAPLLTFYDLPLWSWLLLLLIGAIVGAWLAQRILLGTIRRFTRKTKTRIDDLALKAIGPGLTIAIFVALTWLGLRILPIVFSDFTLDTINNTSFALIALAFAIAAVRLISGLLDFASRREPRWQNVSTVGSRTFAVVIYLIAAMMILNHSGVNVTPLIASVGLVGIAVALALQDTLSNFFAGIWIQAGRTLSQGHLVEFDDPKVIGFVHEIGWRTTKIQSLPNNIVVIPNQTVAKATITDFNLPEPRLGTNMLVRAGFESDPDEVERILLEAVLTVAKETPEFGILAEPPPSTRLERFADSGFEFWLGFQCRDWFAQGNGAGAIRKEIVRRFRERGIRMPYPMNEQYAVPPNRIDIAQGLTGAAYVPERESALGRIQAQNEGAAARSAQDAAASEPVQD